MLRRRPAAAALCLASLLSVGLSGSLAPTFLDSPEGADRPAGLQVASALAASLGELGPLLETAHRGLSFEKNLGQWDGPAGYRVRAPGMVAWVAPDSLALVLGGPLPAGASPSIWQPALAAPEGVPGAAAFAQHAVLMRLVGADPLAPAVEGPPLGQVSNYFLGNDPSGWATSVPHLASLAYRGVYPGIDLVYHADGEGGLKYDFLVHPGANAGAIRLAFEGQDGLALGDDGSLTVGTSLGDLRKGVPVTYQETEAGRQAVESRYFLGPQGVGFAVGDYDATRMLVIDPLVYSTYVGGSGSEFAYDVAVDAMGNAYASGYTWSTNYPTTVGAYQVTSTSTDIFVTKLDPAGAGLVYSTYLGGSSGENGFGLALDGSGDVYLTGETGSSNFPTTAGAYQSALSGGSDAFLAKLDASGSALVYGTYLGGTSSPEAGQEVAVDAGGNAYVSGYTWSTNFPTTPGAFQTSNAGNYDAFVASFDPSGSSLLYSTYLGGTAGDWGYGLDVASTGDAYATGHTRSTNFPVTPGAFQPTHAPDGGDSDVFVVHIDPSGTALAYSTYVGGDSGDVGYAVAVEAGEAYVTGPTWSTNYPVTPGAFQLVKGNPGPGGNSDAFVTKIRIGGTALGYSTYLGGNSQDQGDGIAVDATGRAHVGGLTWSTNYPTTTAAYQTTFAGVYDVIATKLDPTGATLDYSTYIGGSHLDWARGIAIDGAGDIYLAGHSESVNYPVTSGAFQASNAGNVDAFVTKIGPKAGPPPPPPPPPRVASCRAVGLLVVETDAAGGSASLPYAQSQLSLQAAAGAYVAPPGPAPQAPPSPQAHADATVARLHYSNGVVSIDADTVFSRCDATAMHDPNLGLMTDAYARAGLEDLRLAVGMAAVNFEAVDMEIQAFGTPGATTASYACDVAELGANAPPAIAAVCQLFTGGVACTPPLAPVCNTVRVWVSEQNGPAFDPATGQWMYTGSALHVRIDPLTMGAATVDIHLGHVVVGMTGGPPSMATYVANAGCLTPACT